MSYRNNLKDNNNSGNVAPGQQTNMPSQMPYPSAPQPGQMLFIPVMHQGQMASASAPPRQPYPAQGYYPIQGPVQQPYSVPSQNTYQYPVAGSSYPAMGQMYPMRPQYQGYSSADGYSAMKIDDHDDRKYMDTYARFCNPNIRRAFIQKVYFILMIQLLITTGIILLFVFYRPVKIWVQQHKEFYLLAYALFIGLTLTLACCESVRRKFPINYICLFLFTLAMGYLMGVISSYHNTISVLIAFGITTVLCLCISLLATCTSLDFTKCQAFLFFAGIAFMLFGIACVIVLAVSGPNKILQAVYAGVGVLIFSVYLCYNTQMILGGRSHELSEEDYIVGALDLYLDITQMFLMILMLLGLGRE